MGLFGSLFGGKRKGGIGAYADPRRTMQDEMENPYKQRGGGFFSQDTADKLGGLASGLAQAQAYGDGDWSEAEAIGQNRTAARQAANEAAAKQQQLRMIYESLIANGMKPGDAQVIAADPSKAGGFITDRYKPQEKKYFQDGVGNQVEYDPITGKSKIISKNTAPKILGVEGVGPFAIDPASGHVLTPDEIASRYSGNTAPITQDDWDAAAPPYNPTPPRIMPRNQVSPAMIEDVRRQLGDDPLGRQAFENWKRTNGIQ